MIKAGQMFAGRIFFLTAGHWFPRPARALFCLSGIVTLFVFLTGPEPARAADDSTNWSLHVWQTDDGLPNNNVTSLAETGDGYLWVATSARFVRFDGAHFEEFTAKDLLPGYAGYATRANILLTDAHGGLWLAMNRGTVVHLAAGVAEFFTNNLPDYTAQTLVADGAGAVWIAYHGNVVCRIKDHRATRFGTPEGLPARFDCTLASDDQGRIWFAKDGQLGRFQDGRFVTLNQTAGRTVRLTAAHGGGVWVCSGRELFKCDEAGRLQSYGLFTTNAAGAGATCLLEEKNGVLWIGTAADGLFRFDGSRFEKIPTSHPYISSLLPDREGDLWVGTGGGGLDRIRRRAFTLENEATGLPPGTVQSVCEDAQGTVWAATQNGRLLCRTNGGWRVVSGETGWPGGRATCVTADPSGAVWIGTQSHSLICRRDGQFTTLRAKDGFPGHIVSGLLTAADGDLWIVEEDPNLVQRLHADSLTTLVLPPASGVPRALCEDAAGNLWVGTSKGFLLRIRKGVLSDETTNVSGLSSSIRSLAATPDGSLWIGYASWGLGRYQDGHFARITTAQGLFNDFISQIVADGRGWLWFGSDRGLFKVREGELDDALAGRTARVHSIHYGEGNGLPSLQAGFGVSPDVLHSRDDNLWFTMLTVLAVVSLDNLQEDLRPPPVLLKQVSVDKKVIAVYGGVLPVTPGAVMLPSAMVLPLPPGHRRLEFDFTALSFSAPENVRLQYQLTGFDGDWVDAGGERQVAYPRLPAGNYQFQVRAQNGDGAWSGIQSVALAVAPFFWQTWWFRSLAAVLFTLAVIAIVRYVSFRRLHSRLAALEQQAALDKERSRIARDIHDDLGGSLTQIKLLFELTQRSRTAPDRVETLGREGLTATRQIINSMDEIVWAINPRNDSLPHLIDYLGQFAIEFLARADIRCRVDLPDRPVPWAVSPEVRHNLFLAVKETLNNVIRHAGAKEVWLRVTATEKMLTLVIEDDGRGFENKTGNEFADGLPNINRRLAEIGGHCRIESRPGTGTCVTLIFPKPEKK